MSYGDFHLHSTASDGVHSPTWVMETAHANGVRVLALTDHDSTAGLAEAGIAAERLGLELIPGIEISVSFMGRDVHLLAFAFEVGSPHLQQFLGGQRDGRVSRAAAIVELLAKHGVTLSFDRVAEIAAGAAVGRPHVARALVESGYVSSVQEAFDLWLGEGQPAYLGRDRLEPADAIELVHRAGGVVFVAHPVLLGEDADDVVTALTALGVDGLEVFYKHCDDSTVAAFRALAGTLGLAMSGGSDYHGLGNPNDRDIGNIPMPAVAVDAFLAFLAERSANTRIAGGHLAGS